MLKPFTSLATLLAVFSLAAAQAQTPGVGIGTTAPDASAALDIVSSTKGALLPRVADATALASPAAGLLVYQTGAPAGFYYNAGSPGAPSWQRLATAAGTVATASNGLTRTGADIALGGVLTQPTTLVQNGQPLSVLAGTLTLVASSTGTVTSSTGSTLPPYFIGQSFTLTAPATISAITVYRAPNTGSISGTLTLWQGTPGSGTVLSSQPATYAADGAPSTIVLHTPVSVPAGVYAFSLGTGGVFQCTNDVYSGGVLYSGNLPQSIDMRFLVQGAGPALYSSGTGQVGVGTAAPTAQLDVDGSTRLRGLGGAGVVTTDAAGNLSSTTSLGSYDATTAGSGLSQSGTALRLGGLLTQATTIVQGGNHFSLTGGNVGIGTTSPGVPLDVTAVNASYNVSNYGYLAQSGTGTVPGSGGTQSVSIRAAGRIIAPEFNATSDRRLKNIVGRSDQAADLALLNKLRITDYTMRDRAQFGDRRFKKVIAQEVEDVFPQAVQAHTGFLPDIYLLATAATTSADSILTVALPGGLPTAARAGQRLKLLLPHGEAIGTLVAPAAAGSRRLVLRGVADAASGAVFVYGLEHPDVRAVDYEALSMLHVSATQELARKVALLEEQHAAATQRAARAEAAAAADHAALLTMQQQLARLLGEAPTPAQVQR